MKRVWPVARQISPAKRRRLALTSSLKFCLSLAGSDFFPSRVFPVAISR